MRISDNIVKHMKALCEEIGPRPTGSAANKAAVEYAAREFKACGLDVRRQSFACMDWTHGECSLTVDGKEIPVRPSPYSPACDAAGKIICVSSLKELRRAQITGKVVLLREELASEQLMPKGFVFWNPDAHKEIISLLEAGKPLAVLTVSLSAGSFAPVIEDGDFELPCGIISTESAGIFYDGAAAVLKMDTHRTSATAANVIAAWGSGTRKVCFSAHIDTGKGTPGALDNASGAAVLLALATALKGRETDYRIELVLFNGEDYYSIPGEMAYLASHLSHPEEYAFAFNIDGAGLKGQNTSCSFYECPEKLAAGISDAAAQYGGFEITQPWPQGDHMLFAASGIPVIAITSCGIFELAGSLLHTEGDTTELVDAEKLETLADFLLSTVLR